jgi:hypothetical protein
MNQLITPRRLGFALTALVIALLIPTFMAAQGRHPPIPHAVEGFEDCLKCHETGTAGAQQIPDNHIGIENDICTVCHKSDIKAEPAPGVQILIPHAVAGYENCLECHREGGSAPPPAIPDTIPTPTGDPMIPHTLLEREDCLECHQEGDDITPRIPADHEDLTNDMCLNCHQPGEWFVEPTPTPVPIGPIPTPIVHLRSPGGGNSCLDCHATLEEEKHIKVVADWERSIHAERQVTCVDCHGGDPSVSTQDEAKSPDAGYVGVPNKTSIPALCASCHADVTQMRQYDLPTDQYAKYRESIHGLRLAEGDPNVATCADCHSGHMVLKANDPASTVYPANVPVMCASCHADKELMAPYEIFTNQFDLYQQSVHGHALLDDQNFRAPNCATCHGTHGAAPPGFEEVANVCGSCHSATQDYYLTSAHASGSENAPKCITCHGRYDVSKPSEELFLGADPRHCGSCHSLDSGSGEVAFALYNTLDAAAKAYEEAEAAIQAVREVSMLVSPLEGRLREANTALITARAGQHSLDFEAVNERTNKAQEIAAEVQVGAEAAIAESVFRRQAMIIAVVAMATIIVALYLLKLELDRRLDADS